MARRVAIIECAFSSFDGAHTKYTSPRTEFLGLQIIFILLLLLSWASAELLGPNRETDIRRNGKQKKKGREAGRKTLNPHLC